MTAVKISGTISKDSRPDNGLEAIAEQLAKDEFARHVVVGVLELHKVVKEPGEAPVPTVRFVAIEPIEGGDQIDEAMVLLNNARKERGQSDLAATLDFGGQWPGAAPRQPEQLPGQMALDEQPVDDQPAPAGRKRRGKAAVADPFTPPAHEGATEAYAGELAEMKQDLGVVPTTCEHCGVELHYDPAHEAYADAQGWSTAGDGHTHTPAER